MASVLLGAAGALLRRGGAAAAASGGLNLVQFCAFSKYISKARTKRLPLTTKRAGKGFYKGNGARKEGTLNSRGQFFRVKDMCTELVMPDLTNFKLKAYVGAGAKRNMHEHHVEL